MKPDDRELDDEIRGHLAISIKERIDRGEDPSAARKAALKEFGYIPEMRESMRRIWYSRWFDAAAAFARDVRIGLRSLLRAKGLAATIIATLALGIGANAAIFSVVRGVLLRPLVNRGEDRLIYINQNAPSAGATNLTFSVPEIADFRQRSTTVAAFGEFSTIDFTMLGLGQPRAVHAGVVNGTFFDVMGLRPQIGRLLNPSDDGPQAAGAAVLTYRFWTTSLASDPSVVGKTIHLGELAATVVGVLEPSVPYPADTEIIANIVTSPHHLGATMQTAWVHRMTELFGRLKPDATLEAARADLTTAHDAMIREHPEAYASPDTHLRVSGLRDEIASPARTVLWLLLASAAVVFVIACSNVANLILARSVRREGELAVRAALGASRGALRRTLLAESLVLCGAGAALGVALAGPFVTMVSGFAARFSVRALEVSVDASVLYVGAGLAIVAAVLLAFVPRLPSSSAANGFELTSAVRITPGTSRRLRVFATAQIAFSFVLLAGTGALVAALVAMQTSTSGYDVRQVLVFDLPMPRLGRATPAELNTYREMTSRIAALPGVDGVALSYFVPWRDAGSMFDNVSFAADGYTPAKGEESPRARLRIVSPRFFDLVGMRLVAGRDFSDDDRRETARVAIVTQSVAQRMFGNGDALNRNVWWTDPNFGTPVPLRIVGVVADADDMSIVRGPAPAIYQPFQQFLMTRRLFVRTAKDPYALVQPVTRTIRELSPNQPVERPSTLEDVRATLIAPERLNAFVFAGFAGVALLVAVVGVAGVLAFGVSARTREFGVRLAVGSTPRALLLRVLSEGARIIAAGIGVGVVGGYVCVALAARYLGHLELPGVLPVLAAAVVLISAAVAASLLPAARAARVDVLQALRSE